MINTLKTKFKDFLESDVNFPLLAGFISGFYPLLFFYSNNYHSNNSFSQFLFFFTITIVAPVVVLSVSYLLVKRHPNLTKYKMHLLFILLISFTSVFMSLAMYMLLKKKILLLIFLLACVASLKYSKYYKYIIIILFAMSVIPGIKVAIHIYEDIANDKWLYTNDMSEVKFVHTPNIYVIQPDGYVNKPIMEAAPYSYNNDFYSWLAQNNFKVYDDFRSNYPASLSSNASMFTMKQHYFSNSFIPALEMPNAREAILENITLKILKNNNYQAFFIAQDEYFQQNRSNGLYDHYNIEKHEIPFFGRGGKIKKDVYKGLVEAMSVKTNSPKFFFVEKVLPHHIYFKDSVSKERDDYITKVKEVNVWLQKTLNMITKSDPEAIIILLADHGGWVGMESFDEFFSTKNPNHIQSTFGTLAAIKWNNISHEEFDKNLKSNVNVFRVLFSALSEDKSYLEGLEKNGSYNIRYDGIFTKSVYELIDDKGRTVSKRH